MAEEERIKIVGCAGGALLAMMLAIIGLWLFGHKTEALFLLGAVLVVITAVAASAWAAFLVNLGSKIALAAQISDDERDQALLDAVVNTTKSLTQSQRTAQSELPAFPLPQQNRWPQLTEFSEGEFREIGGRDEREDQ